RDLSQSRSRGASGPDRALFVVKWLVRRSAPAPGIVAGARWRQGRSCPRPRCGPGRGSTWTPAARRLVRRLSGAGGDVSGRWSLVAVLELAVAREWLVRRAGVSGCEPAALDAESFPECPPGSLAARRRASSI